MFGQEPADLVDALLHRFAVGGVDRQDHQRSFAVAGDRPDPVGDPRDFSKRRSGLRREGVDDRGGAGDLQVVQFFAEPADGIQVVFGEAAGTVEDDHRRDLFGLRRAVLSGLALEGVEGAGRFGVLGQEAGLPGGGGAVDPPVQDRARDPDDEPDGERHPPPARSRHRRRETLDRGLRGSRGCQARNPSPRGGYLASP